MPLGMGYWFIDSLMFLATRYEVSMLLFLVSSFLSQAMSLCIWELAHEQDIGFWVTADYGISALCWIACDRWRSGFISCMCFFRVR